MVAPIPRKLVWIFFLSFVSITQFSNFWVMSYGNWKHILCIFKLWKQSYDGKVVIIQQLWDPWQWVVTSDPLRLLAFYSIGFVSFAFLFKHNTLHAQSITHPHFALLFQLLSSSSHFSSLEKPSASKVVKLSSRRHELAVEGHNLSLVVCFANFAILGMFFTFSLSFPCPLLYLLRCCSVIFFFSVKIYF